MNNADLDSKCGFEENMRAVDDCGGRAERGGISGEMRATRRITCNASDTTSLPGTRAAASESAVRIIGRWSANEHVGGQHSNTKMMKDSDDTDCHRCIVDHDKAKRLESVVAGLHSRCGGFDWWMADSANATTKRDPAIEMVDLNENGLQPLEMTMAFIAQMQLMLATMIPMANLLDYNCADGGSEPPMLQPQTATSIADERKQYSVEEHLRAAQYPHASGNHTEMPIVGENRTPKRRIRKRVRCVEKEAASKVNEEGSEGKSQSHSMPAAKSKRIRRRPPSQSMKISGENAAGLTKNAIAGHETDEIENPSELSPPVLEPVSDDEANAQSPDDAGGGVDRKPAMSGAPRRHRNPGPFVDVVALHDEAVLIDDAIAMPMIIAMVVARTFRRSIDEQLKFRTALSSVLLDGLSIEDAIALHGPQIQAKGFEIYRSRCIEAMKCVRLEYPRFLRHIDNATTVMQCEENSNMLMFVKFNKSAIVPAVGDGGHHRSISTDHSYIPDAMHSEAVLLTRAHEAILANYLKILHAANFPIQARLILALAKTIYNRCYSPLFGMDDGEVGGGRSAEESATAADAAERRHRNSWTNWLTRFRAEHLPELREGPVMPGIGLAPTFSTA